MANKSDKKMGSESLDASESTLTKKLKKSIDKATVLCYTINVRKMDNLIKKPLLGEGGLQRQG